MHPYSHWRKESDPEVNPDLDPLVRGADADPDPHQNVTDPQHWLPYVGSYLPCSLRGFLFTVHWNCNNIVYGTVRYFQDFLTTQRVQCIIQCAVRIGGSRWCFGPSQKKTWLKVPLFWTVFPDRKCLELLGDLEWYTHKPRSDFELSLYPRRDSSKIFLYVSRLDMSHITYVSRGSQLFMHGSATSKRRLSPLILWTISCWHIGV